MITGSRGPCPNRAKANNSLSLARRRRLAPVASLHSDFCRLLRRNTAVLWAGARIGCLRAWTNKSRRPYISPSKALQHDKARNFVNGPCVGLYTPGQRRVHGSHARCAEDFTLQYLHIFVACAHNTFLFHFETCLTFCPSRLITVYLNEARAHPSNKISPSKLATNFLCTTFQQARQTTWASQDELFADFASVFGDPPSAEEAGRCLDDFLLLPLAGYMQIILYEYK